MSRSSVGFHLIARDSDTLSEMSRVNLGFLKYSLQQSWGSEFRSYNH